MNRLSFLRNPYTRLTPLLGLTVIAAAMACGSIDDPTKNRSNERIETISGALTGTDVPANAHVALVWKVGTEGKWAVFSDAAVVNGSFSMNLTTPPANYFVKVDADDYDSLSGGSASTPPSSGGATRLPSPSPSGGSSGQSSSSGSGDKPGIDSGVPSSSSGGASGSSGGKFHFDQRISPRDNVSGTITQPLSAALAGFVVYVDKNGNGKLDLDNNSSLSTPDEIVGGNKELLLVFFKDGGGLDYEKLRDKSGILPHAGYNLAWADEERWLPLNVVELKVSAKAKLPRAVCDHDGGPIGTDPYYPSDPDPNTTLPAPSIDGGAAPSHYPDPNDPNLQCKSDGSSFTYFTPCTTPVPMPTPAPTPAGLCSSSWDETSGGTTTACSPSWNETLPPVGPIPYGWPCPVPTADAGVASSSSGTPVTDAGTAPLDGGGS